LDIELTALGDSVVFPGDTFGWNLYNDSSSSVSWRTSAGGDYVQISNFVFIEPTSSGKRLYLIQEGINEGSYNTNVLIILLPNSFNL
jgi:spore coat protein U-like protein